VTTSQLKRILQQGGQGITGRRYDTVAAASKVGGVQVCNVVLRKQKGSSPEKFWSAVRAVQKACRG